MDTPVHDHDCDGCIYLGGEGPRPGEPPTNQVDMYFCPKSDGGTLLRRYSSEGAEYASFPTDIAARFEKYQTGYRIAQMRGLI